MGIAERSKLGPLDHGRRLALTTFEDADYVPGFKYEIIDGRLYVSPQPNPSECALENWLRDALTLYSAAHPEVINFVASKGRVFLPRRRRATIPEPDVAAYYGYPEDRFSRQLRWRDVTPILVAEVLVEGEFEKDLGRNPVLYLSVPSIQEYWVLNGSEEPSEPSLIQHRRRGKQWAITVYPFGSTFTTKLLPGFKLDIDPRHRLTP
jgi:Uma2 family endonuclease